MMKLFPFSTRRRSAAPLIRLSAEDLAFLLDAIEDLYAEAAGERLSSSEFYERYTAGEFDTPFAMVWGTYYDAYRRRAHAPSRAHQRALEALPPVGSLAAC